MRAKLIIFIFIFNSSLVFSAPIANVGVFNRCYSQLTQDLPIASTFGQNLMNQVKSGTKDPVVACMEVLDKARFTNNNGNRIANLNDRVSISVLNTMNNLHYSFLETQTVPEIGEQYFRNMVNFFDSTSAALYMTKALFDPSFGYDKILSGDVTYKTNRASARTNSFQGGFPAGTVGVQSRDHWIVKGVSYPNQNDLRGLTTMPRNWTVPYMFDDERNEGGDIITGNGIVNRHWGGGMIGNQFYMIQASKLTEYNFRADGGVKVNRRWARGVLKDVLCRELPAVRESDGRSFVSATSPITFRNAAGCVKCHVTMDRMAGVTRDVYVKRVAKFYNKGHWGMVEKHTINQAAGNVFPTTPDANYYRRPTQGVLYFRTHSGQLVNQNVSSVEDLGSKLAATDDMYICQAKRYYKYFTGIDADTGDVADIDHPGLSADQRTVRQIVINLGLSFKQHKDPRQLIEDILSRPEYKLTDFGVRSPASE